VKIFEPEELAGYLEYTNLKVESSSEDIILLCEQARQHSFATVCVSPVHIALAAQTLEDSEVIPCAVISYPLGISTTETKCFEAGDAVSKGAKEIDLVINGAWFHSTDWELFEKEVTMVIDAIPMIPCKVVIEARLLTEQEKITASQICKKAGAAGIKTSTGFQRYEANEEDISIIRKAVGPDMLVKASGWIKRYAEALRVIEAGADRIGTTAAVRIMNDLAALS